MKQAHFAPRSLPHLFCLALTACLVFQGCVSDSALPAAPENPSYRVSASLARAARNEPGEGARAEALLRTANPSRRAALQNELLTLLSLSDLPEEGRLWLIQALPLVADGASAQALVALSQDPRWRSAAVDTLVRIPGGELEVAVLRELSSADSRVRLPLIDVVERRRMQAAVPALSGFVRSEDEALAAAAVRALGNIGGEASFLTLSRMPLRPGFEGVRARALVSVLAALSEQRGLSPALRTEALASCRELLRGPWPLALRASALRSLVRYDGVGASVELLACLRNERGELQEAAVKAAALSGYSDLGAVVVSAWPGFSESVRLALLEAYAAEGSPTTLPLSMAALVSPEVALREKAASLLPRFAGIAEVPQLLSLVEAQGGPAPEAALVLVKLGAPGVDAVLREQLGRAGPAFAASLLEICGTRGDRAVFNPAFVTVESGLSRDAALRASALETVRLLATAEDLPQLLTLLDKLESVSEIRILEQAVQALAPRHPAPAACAADFLARLAEGGRSGAATRVLQAGLAGLDTPQADSWLAAGLSVPGTDAWRDLVRLIGASGQFSHAGHLLSTARAASGPDRALALKSLLVLSAQASGTPAVTRAQLLVTAYPLIENNSDRQACLELIEGLTPGAGRALRRPAQL